MNKRIRGNEEYISLIKYSEEFKETLRNMNVECELDGKEVILRSRNMKDIERVERMYFNEDAEYTISKRIIEDRNIEYFKDNMRDMMYLIKTEGYTLYMIARKEDMSNMIIEFLERFGSWNDNRLIEADIKREEAEAKRAEEQRKREEAERNIIQLKKEKEEREERIKSLEQNNNLLTEPITLNRITFPDNFMKLDDNEASIREIGKYLSTGEMIAESEEVINIKHLIKCIYLGEGNKLYNDSKIKIYSENDKKKVPFIFVCTSSGTGKTQLAFSLDIPLLYFNFNLSRLQNDSSNSNMQKIYKSYINVSDSLIKSI